MSNVFGSVLEARAEEVYTPKSRWDWDRKVNELDELGQGADFDYSERDPELVVAVHLEDRTVCLDPKTEQEWDADAYWAADALTVAGWGL